MGVFIHWAGTAALLAQVAGAAVAWGADGGADGVVAVGVEEFLGSTGDSAEQLLRLDLDRSGTLRAREDGVGGGWRLRGSSSAGRIDGALLDAQGAMVFNNHYADADLRDHVHAFADDVVTAITQGRGLAASKLAFVGSREGRRQIYVADSDGERIQQVTSDAALKGSPSLGPGGVLMAYTSWQSGFGDVVLKDLRDGRERTILSAPGTNSGAAFSLDGTRLALTMSYQGNAEIYMASVSGSRVRRLTHARSVEFSPAWGPEGNRVVFCSDAGGGPQLYVVGRQGGAAERVETGYRHNTSPEWSADGVHLAFTGRQGGGPAVVVHDLASGQNRVLLARGEEPTWAPDGRHVAAVLDGALVVVDSVTGRRRTIVRGFSEIREPSWSR